MTFLDLRAGTVLTLPADATFSEPTVHVFDQPSIDAINAALAANRPLLVRGEPGTGKSQLARAAGVALGRAVVSRVIDARTEARDLLWSFDSVARLAEAQIQGVLGVRDPDAVRASLREELFLTPGPLWWAFDWTSAEEQSQTARVEPLPRPEGWGPAQGTVVLIDEIDKADPAVPNGLLESLGSGCFSCPGGRVVTRKAKPLVIITTNEERALPDAFLRRCLVLQLGWPEKREELIAALVARGRAHFPKCGERVLTKAAETVADDRQKVINRGLYPPGGAEYLDLVRALTELAPDDEERQIALLGRVARFTLDKHPAEPPW